MILRKARNKWLGRVNPVWCAMATTLWSVSASRFFTSARRVRTMCWLMVQPMCRRNVRSNCRRETDVAGPVFRVDTVDTTGAGDLYHAGYLYGVLEGWGLARRMRFAAAAAALATTALGARGKLATVSEIEALLVSAPVTAER